MTILIVVIVIIVCLVLISFFLLKRIVSQLDKQSKLYFALKLQEYDELVTEREEKLEEIKNEQKTEEAVSNADERENNHPSVVVYKKENPEYQIDDLLKIVKKVDDKFHVNGEEIVSSFLQHNPTKEELLRYNKLRRMRRKILDIGVYNIISNEDENYLNNLFNELRMIDVDIVDNFVFNVDSINIEEFLNYLVNEIQKCDPHIYVEVGDKNVSYDYLSNRVVTTYNDKIYVGLMIIYRDKMYDYSLS